MEEWNDLVRKVLGLWNELHAAQAVQILLSSTAENEVSQVTDRTTKAREPDRGPEWFQKLFEKIGHHDDWGVICVYDYAAWRLCKAAMRRQRKRSNASTDVHA